MVADFDLQLSEPGPITSGGRAKGVVQGHPKALTVRGREDHMVPVFVDANESQVLHGWARSWLSSSGVEDATPTKWDQGGTPRRRG